MTASLHDRLHERRRQLRLADDVFGLEYVEVCSPTSLHVHVLGRIPDNLTDDHLRLREKATACPVEAHLVDRDEDSPDDRFDLTLPLPLKEQVEYILGFDPEATFESPLDPIFAEVSFRLGHSHPAPIDCKPIPPARAPNWPSPELNYLAKDYASFRQLLLDRLAVTMPDWRERNPADVGIMLVEVLAYAADHLSYMQDAVGTEAYLSTCRLRTSLRRHARLIDYRMHEGCNARAWVHLIAGRDVEKIDRRDLYFQAIRRLDPDLVVGGAQPASVVETFEPVVSEAFSIHVSHNECRLYDWTGARPCVPIGATSAVLVDYPDAPTRNPVTGPWLRFQEGDVLLLEELRGIRTGAAADADPKHRHYVRLTRVERKSDPLAKVGANADKPLPLLEIHWHEEDALPYTAWIRLPGDDPDPSRPVTVVRGNNLLVDHGRRRRERVVVEPSHSPPPAALAANYPPSTLAAILAAPDLTFSDNLPPSGRSAAAQFQRSARAAVPQILLLSVENGEDVIDEFTWLELRDFARVSQRIVSATFRDESLQSMPATRRVAEHAKVVTAATNPAAAGPIVHLPALRNAVADDMRNVWQPRNDLLDSSATQAHFVVEMTDQREARLRFGRDGFGRDPKPQGDPPKRELVACFRTGTGTAGNVPAEAIDRVLTHGTPIGAIRRVRNPKPAEGGVDPEPAEEVRLFAPHALRFRLQRAISPADYEVITMREFGHVLQKVRVDFLWTGHEIEVRVAVDRRGREPAEPELLAKIEAALQPYRRIGHEVRVVTAERVVPQLKLEACLGPRVLREQVRKDLNDLFSNRIGADGSLGFFHPDRLSFADGLSSVKSSRRPWGGRASCTSKYSNCIGATRDQPTSWRTESSRCGLARSFASTTTRASPNSANSNP